MALRTDAPPPPWIENFAQELAKINKFLADEGGQKKILPPTIPPWQNFLLPPPLKGQKPLPPLADGRSFPLAADLIAHV